MNVWDTFCIGKTMTCELCFVPAIFRSEADGTSIITDFHYYSFKIFPRGFNNF